MDALELIRQNEHKNLLRFVTAGSVDDGKSTLIGRLLLESKGIYEDQLASIRNLSRRSDSQETGEMDLALVTDGLKAEREQGITIDVAYRYFSTPRRKFIIADTPGHEQYTRNMATGASTADLMVILIDATLGVQTQSRRHAFIGALLGIPHLVVTVNKMDLVDYDETVFNRIRDEFSDFAAKVEARDLTFIPVSALRGDNVVRRSEQMPWYQGSTLLNHLETVHVASDRNLIDLRLPVQYAWRPDATFRGYMGTVASGVLRPGDEVMSLPSGTRGRVRRIATFDGDLTEAFPPLAVTVELDREIDVSRGNMLVHVHNVPQVGNTVEAMLVWMAEEPMKPGKQYLVKHCTQTVGGTVGELRYRMDVNTMHRLDAEVLNLNEIGRVVLTLNRPIMYDAYNRNRATGALIVIDRVTNNTVGAGMIIQREPSDYVHTSERWRSEPRSEHVERRAGLVTPQERAVRLGQKPVTVWLTGLTGSGKTTVAQMLEKRLFDAGRHVMVLDGENARLSFSRDLDFSAEDRSENIRRAAEVARLMNDAGLIVLCAFLSPYGDDRRRARETVGAGRFVEVYLSAPVEVCAERKPAVYAKARSGEIVHFSGVTAPYEPPESPDLELATHELSAEACVDRVMTLLREQGVLG
ncbi:MAG: sulfate adenylyltransferase subunit CysN [Planctomycetes bacterium]|nr:sulfate adenylyltransferase subunit CysN [Planctomycetota bacterium]